MKDGRWRLYARVPVSSGGTKRKAFYGWTRTEAQKKFKAALKQGVVIDVKKQTLQEYLEGWYYDPALKPKSIESRLLNIQRASKIIGGIRLDKVTPDDIRRVDDSLLAKGLSGATRLQCFVTLSAAFRQAVMDEKLVVSPFARIKWRPKVPRTQERIITHAEKVKLFSLDDEWTNLWKLISATGMREGEVLALTWPNVDMEMGLIHVRQTIDEVPFRVDPRGYRLGTPKTENSTRTLTLDKAVLDVLVDIRQSQEAEANRIGEAWDNPEQFIFTRLNGRPVLSTHALWAFKQSLKKVGIWDGDIKSPSNAYIHHLRHTFGYDHLNGGTPILHVSRMMGHSSVAFTMEVYGHISRDTELEAAKLSSSLLADVARDVAANKILEATHA